MTFAISNPPVNSLVRGVGIVSYDPSKPADVQSLANDSTFLNVVNAKLGAYHSPTLHNGQSGTPETDAFVEGVKKTLANTDLSTLSVEERAQIIESLTPAGYSVNRNLGSTQPNAPKNVQALIAQLSNNQGYAGPDAAETAAIIPTALGGTVVTKGQLYDDESFSALADQVFLAAGGQPKPAMQLPPNVKGTVAVFGRPTGLPSQLLDGLSGADMSKWSESERVSFLNKVAELGKDGTLSDADTSTLYGMISANNRTGDSAPAAVTDAKGNSVMSKDDIMEDGTLRNYLAGRVDKQSELFRSITKADYSKLSYDERVGLVQMMQTASADFVMSDSEQADLKKLLASDLATSESTSQNSSAATLSNGVSVSAAELSSPNHFASTVQRTLRGSGLLVTPTSRFGHAAGTTPPGSTTLPYYSTDYGLQRLIGLDTSKLTADQRLEVLQRIATAGADANVTPQESRDIVKYVDQLSGRPNTMI
jgi:hypothetical protein